MAPATIVDSASALFNALCKAGEPRGGVAFIGHDGLGRGQQHPAGIRRVLVLEQHQPWQLDLGFVDDRPGNQQQPLNAPR